MSYQQWGGRPAAGPWQQQGYPQAGFGQGYGQPAFGRQGPGYAPQGPFGGGPQRPPRRRGGAGTMLLIGLGLIGLFALIGFVATGLHGGSNNSDVAYQNDDYRVPPPDLSPPPLPVPDTYEQAQDLITNSPFYGQQVPAPVRCDATPINVGTASDAQLEDHFTKAMECLVRVWEPPVTGAKLIIVRPSVTIYGSKMTTKCGTSGVNAFYCAADQQVYYSNQLARAVPIVADDKWAADVVIAHEFGHALQARTGILISAKALGQNSNDEQTDLLYSRRLETQADCFSGMYIRAVATSLGIQQSDVQGIEDTYKAVGDDQVTGDPTIVGNHGLARSRVFWGDKGLGSADISACNTFTAPKNEVR
ncbi:neutral zinc metallopeptidase [Microlunatus flavus]|uniref:neutral zinc metallopeptidase n=1 Tax=Microlunatus flavus TaxID=1036181 RepID=UPI0011144BC8|nr:neutral zinc metallopeptidase [Microlunatus flavus]